MSGEATARRRIGPAGLAAILVLAGCSATPVPPVAAAGKLVGYRGKSPERVVVSLWPLGDPRAPVKSALCKSDGSFALECAPGDYKVTVTPAPGAEAAVPAAAAPGDPIPPACRDSLKTPLRVTVPPGGTDTLVVDLGAR